MRWGKADLLLFLFIRSGIRVQKKGGKITSNNFFSIFNNDFIASIKSTVNAHINWLGKLKSMVIAITEDMTRNNENIF